MAYYKEIVTKAVIGKGKKTTKDNQTITVDDPINNVLGCWVINHSFSGYNNNGIVIVNGSYDINVWYSFDNNTKTNVLIRKFNYEDKMNVHIKENSKLTNNSEIIVRSLSQPSVTDVQTENGVISLIVQKQMGVEIVGDTKVRVSVADDYDDYEEIVDEDDIEIKEDYLE